MTSNVNSWSRKKVKSKSNLTSVGGTNQVSNCFEFDSDTNKEVYSRNNSGGLDSPEIVFANKTNKKSRHSDMPPGMSDISKTEEGELISESEFEKMKIQKNYDKRITFGFSTPNASKENNKKIEENDKTKNSLAEIIEEKSDNSNIQNRTVKVNERTIIKNESRNEIIENDKNKKITRRGTLETEDLFRSNSVDMSFDGKGRKNKQESLDFSGKDNIQILNGLDEDFNTPLKISSERQGKKFHGFSAPPDSKKDENVFKNLKLNGYENKKEKVEKVLNNKSVDFVERNKQLIKQKSEMVKSQRNVEHERALEMIRKRTHSAQNLLKPRKGRSSLNVNIGNHHSLQSLEKRLKSQNSNVQSNEPRREQNLFGNTLDSVFMEKSFKKMGTIDMKPKLVGKGMLESKFEKQDFDSRKTSQNGTIESIRKFTIDSMKGGRKQSKTSLNMKMTIPKEGLAGGNIDRLKVSEIIGEVSKEGLEDSEEEEKKKQILSKSGILGQRLKESSVKIYKKRGSLIQRSHRRLDVAGILSGEEEQMNQYRSKSQGVKRKSNGIVGMHDIKRKMTNKSRIYERESLGNFEKQLYESENLEGPNNQEDGRRGSSKRSNQQNFNKKIKEHKEVIGSRFRCYLNCILTLEHP